MSLASSGSSFQGHSYAFLIEDASQVGEVRRFVARLASELMLDEVRQGRLSIIVNELGNNLLKYAQGGRLVIRKMTEGDLVGVEVLSLDKGPGFDVSRSMEDGYTTGSTPGTGLGAVRRQADEFDIYSATQGSAILARVYLHEKRLLGAYDIGAVNVPFRGESVCGDSWQARLAKNDLDVFVVDGLGHGAQAHQAAMEAVAVFEQSAGLSLDRFIQAVHGRLKATRGGAVFALKARQNHLEFSGVGNIRALVHTAGTSKTLISQNGTAGLQIRAARPLQQSWDEQGYLILHSDGLSSRWSLSDYPGIYSKHPALVAGVLYRDHDRGSDDVTVVVARKARHE